MIRLTLGLMATCAGMLPACQPNWPVEPVEPAPIEHVIWDGDQSAVDVSPPDTMTVRFGRAYVADGPDEWDCADMGGTYTERDFGAGPEGACERIDY